MKGESALIQKGGWQICVVANRDTADWLARKVNMELLDPRYTRQLKSIYIVNPSMTYLCFQKTTKDFLLQLLSVIF